MQLACIEGSEKEKKKKTEIPSLCGTPLWVTPVSFVCDPCVCDPNIPSRHLQTLCAPCLCPALLHKPSDCCICCSGVAAAIVDSRAASTPQSRVLGRTRNLLGLATHIWVQGLLRWNDVKPLLLACNSLCCPGSALDDWSAPQPTPTQPNPPHPNPTHPSPAQPSPTQQVKGKLGFMYYDCALEEETKGDRYRGCT